MIRPDMATMLAFVATDAAVEPSWLQSCLERAVAESFHCITVDGDTSTNDACVLAATGRQALPPGPQARGSLEGAVREVCIELARGLVRDGEGATKLITVEVRGGADAPECRQVADAVAQSPLVKTAFFASDPNWGRILAAVGRAGVTALDIARVTIYLDGVCIVRAGARAAEYREEQGREVMAREEITVRVDLGRGQASVRLWTCDLSYDYVRINAEYRT
jgi:glutamate N-acetyltransferase/amino-acid N-acetyltransferase